MNEGVTTQGNRGDIAIKDGGDGIGDSGVGCGAHCKLP